MIRLACLVFSCAALLAGAPAQAWGPLGHRVSAAIAERNIDGKTRAHVVSILGTTGLAEVSTVPDEQRNNPDPFWQGAAGWHRTQVPRGADIANAVSRAEGDSLVALDWAVATLRDPVSGEINRRRALAFVVHLVADTHLPVHFNAEHWGGGDFPVNWFGRETTMHWAFEEGLPLQKQLSASEYADQLSRNTTSVETIDWWTADPQVWMRESLAMRERLYAEVEASEQPMQLGYQFVYDWTPDMELRLRQSGIRLAAYLDWIFADD